MQQQDLKKKENPPLQDGGERYQPEKWDKKTRYALVVTIKTPEEKMDIYTPVAIKIGIKVPIEIKI